MRDFLMGVFSTMCLATASLMFVATAVGEGSLAGMFCSRPAGGCSPSLGNGHCVGQCTDEDLGSIRLSCGFGRIRILEMAKCKTRNFTRQF